MIELRTPQDQLIAKVENRAVDAYLREHSLAGRKISTRAVFTVFDKNIETQLLELKNPASTVFRAHKEGFNARVHHALLEGKAAFIHLLWRDIRHYYTLTGFVDGMNRIAEAESPVEILIPAGRYGDDYVFALRKAV